MSEVTGKKPFPLLDVTVNRPPTAIAVRAKGTYATGSARKKLLLESVMSKIKKPCSDFCSAGKTGGGERAEVPARPQTFNSKPSTMREKKVERMTFDLVFSWSRLQIANEKL